jgi:hypothetical protein
MQPISWKVVGTSLTGKAHIENKTPCQDAHHIELYGDTSGIAVVSDGAGSCEYSHLGSGFVVQRATEKVKGLLDENPWLDLEQVVDEKDWSAGVTTLFKELQEDLRQFAQEEAVDFKSLSCTLILLVFSPHRILVAHIGDGRAGYANHEGEWKSLMMPFKGEQVGQTVFLTTEWLQDAWDQVVEAKVINDSVSAFTLMSDGCELACWKCYDKYPDEERYYDPNSPDQDFFDHNVKALRSMYISELSNQEVEEKWAAFLQNGNDVLRKETDDKTMILGVFVGEENQPKISTAYGDQADYE